MAEALNIWREWVLRALDFRRRREEAICKICVEGGGGGLILQYKNKNTLKKTKL